MPDDKPAQAVRLEVGHDRGQAWIRLSTASVPAITIPIDPQAAFECAEQLARAAHTAKFGTEPQSDSSYLHEQIRSRVTEELRDFLARRVSVMLNSLREDRTWTNQKLAGELVDVVLTKVA